MFVTTESMRLDAVSRLIPGIDVWDAVEVELAVPMLLLVGAEAPPSPDAMINRTFLARAHHLANLGGESKVCLSSVDLFSPPSVNGSDGWRLDPVTEVWKCREASDGAWAWLFVLADGRQLSDSVHRSVAADLIRHKCLYMHSAPASRTSK